MSKFPEEKINELRAYPISYRIQQLRWWSDLSQRAFAREIECTQPTLCRWEQGQKIPNGKVLARITQYFDLPSDFFLDAEIQRVKLLKKRRSNRTDTEK